MASTYRSGVSGVLKNIRQWLIVSVFQGVLAAFVWSAPIYPPTHELVMPAMRSAAARQALRSFTDITVVYIATKKFAKVMKNRGERLMGWMTLFIHKI